MTMVMIISVVCICGSNSPLVGSRPSILTTVVEYEISEHDNEMEQKHQVILHQFY